MVDLGDAKSRWDVLFCNTLNLIEQGNLLNIHKHLF